MAEPSFEFPYVSKLWAWARGAPGKRTFYLQVSDDSRWLRIWLEKEELLTLSTAVEGLLKNLGQEEGTAERAKKDVESEEEPSDEPTAEFKLGQLTLDYEEENKVISMGIHEADSDFKGSPTVLLRAKPSQMQSFRRRIGEICAAGRPLCILCKSPIDPEGHMCIRGNGHRSLTDIQQ
ncbi:MAG: DUF3090 family protein [Dehalococcoidia bacterium]